jgi:hypothetical protein
MTAVLRSTHKKAAYTAKQVDRLAEQLLTGQSTSRAREARALLAQLTQITRDQALMFDMIEEILRRLPPVVAEMGGAAEAAVN